MPIAPVTWCFNWDGGYLIPLVASKHREGEPNFGQGESKVGQGEGKLGQGEGKPGQGEPLPGMVMFDL